ncbi:hypothetical protein [Microbacterium sp. SYP-A9085]|uniref:hypothetical protein n=1 Tax=Microbacterium sp. SYP-A9085 TaxID=2664454 RepID=UPI003463ACE0
MALALVFAALIAVLAAFQLALALGAPWGRFAWGGQHPGVLPRRYRIGSVVSLLIYAVMALIALDRSGVVDVVPAAVSAVAMWVVFGMLALGIVMNAASRSRPERFTMTPAALVLAALALVVALVGPVRAFTGMVLDTGDGPVFCTIVMDSYPPQCGDPRPVAGWDWDAVDHNHSGATRWGDYRFSGVLEGGVVTLVGEVAAT